MNKTAIKNFAINARVQLISAVKQKAFEYGITEDNYDVNINTVSGRLLTNEEKEQRKELIEQIKLKGYSQVMEEVAYTWFNRFIALRFMEVNEYLPSRVRVFTNENNQFKPEIIKEALNVEIDGLNRNKVIDLIEKNDDEKLYKYLIITQCNALGGNLHYVFEKVANWTELLFPNNLLKPESVIGKMISDISVSDWKDDVEIIGWLYQYYISEKHEEVIDPLHGTIVKKEDIPAATQLFTTDWVVRYIVDNSLGRYWIERNPNSKLEEKLTYFVKPKSGEIKRIDENIKPEDIKVLDPCVGSGHFLSYAFDVLLEIYRECGWADREATKCIIENNLYGLDIDDRAAQLACFAVLMKARKYNRRILNSEVVLHIVAMQDSTGLSDDLIQFISQGDITIKQVLNELQLKFDNAKEYGSIIKMDDINLYVLRTRLEDIKKNYYANLLDMSYQKKTDEVVNPLVNQAEILLNKYDIVVTNPPYLNKYSPKLKKYVSDYYKDYKGDLFSVFIYRNFDFCKLTGYSGFMTPNVWMFISSYEKLRKYILNNKSIVTLVQMAKGAFFKEATVDVCAFVFLSKKTMENGLYLRLEDFKGDMEVQKQKVLEANSCKECGYFYEASQDNFTKIPGSPIAYWASKRVISLYGETYVSAYGNSRKGMATGCNDEFVRCWFELEIIKIGFNLSKEEARKSSYKWFPYANGGSYRKWYGNDYDVVLWENDGERLQKEKTDDGKRLRAVNLNLDYIFTEGITWTSITSSFNSFRMLEKGGLFSSASNAWFGTHKNYILAFLNSKICSTLLIIRNPTMNANPGDISTLPISISNEDSVNLICLTNVEISKDDWNNFELSRGFKKNPLI